MAEENLPEMGTPAETPAPEQPEKKAAEIASDPKAAELEAELDKVRKALKDANKEAADRRKRLEELEKAEQERLQSQMSEQEKMQARLKELEALTAEKDRLLKEKERQDLQRKVAKAVGLPEGLAARLAGDDEEAMTADAKSILELLPKPQEVEKKPAPRLEPTNPGDAKQGETRAQIKERLGLAGSVNPWSSSGAVDRGGGVVVVEKD